MDVLMFFSNLVRDLAWPILILVLLFASYKRAPKLMRIVKSIRYGDIEVTLREIFDEAREEVAAIKSKPDAPVVSESQVENTDKILELAKVSTGAAITELWKLLEIKILEVVRGDNARAWMAPREYLRILRQENRISASELELLENLRRIRNSAVHSENERPLTIAEVLEYKDFVDSFLTRFKAVTSDHRL